MFDAESEFDEEADRKKCLQCRRVPTSTPLGFKLLPPVLILTVKRYLILGGEKLTESVRPSHYIAVGTADPVPLSPPRRAAPQPSPSRDGSPPRKSPRYRNFVQTFYSLPNYNHNASLFRKDAEVSSSGVDAAADLNVSANTTGSLDAEEIPGDKVRPLSTLRSCTFRHLATSGPMKCVKSGVMQPVSSNLLHLKWSDLMRLEWSDLLHF